VHQQVLAFSWGLTVMELVVFILVISIFSTVAVLGWCMAKRRLFWKAHELSTL